jgi:protein XRP2
MNSAIEYIGDGVRRQATAFFTSTNLRNMGHLFSSCIGQTTYKANKYTASPPSTSTSAAPSWANRKRIDPKDVMFSKLKSGVHIKHPGSINGQSEFVIEECAECTLLVLDHVVQATIDDCRGCTILIGASEGRYP